MVETPTVMRYIREVGRRARAPTKVPGGPDDDLGVPAPQSRLEMAADHADIGTIVPGDTRLRYVKRAMVRVSRHFTHHQVAFNHAIVAALAEERPPVEVTGDPALALALAALDVQVEALQEQVRALEDDNRRLRGTLMATLGVDERDALIARRAERGSLDEFYVAFEEAFRGSRAHILGLFAEYVDDLVAAAERTGGRVLDLGPGRCELLELLAERTIDAYGVDANEAMVAAGCQRGFDVVEGDALSHLRSLPDASLGAVTGMQIIEHIGLEDQIDLADEAHRVLRPGGVIILETPNPTTWQVGANTFYLDPTHRRPVHPLFLDFLLSSRGFVAVEVRMLHAVEDVQITPPDGADDATTELISRFNEVYAGPQDYAVLGVRPELS